MTAEVMPLRAQRERRKTGGGGGGVGEALRFRSEQPGFGG